jgi:glycosyltransferase involved in cell wall biosynthesis
MDKRMDKPVTLSPQQQKASAELKISVIMPALNEGPNVDLTLNTLLKQTHLPAEIIIADGGSKDDTVERALRFNQHLPVRVVKNEAVFCGGGRNAATKAAQHDLIVSMDFGNLADPHYLEAMANAFILDPTVDYVGGPHHTMAHTPFERAYAAILDYGACLVPTIPRDKLLTMVDHTFIPGGMNLAYRRSIWERAGGFCEWAGSCDDVLFGHRVRAIGGKIVPTADAIVHYHTATTTREVFRRHVNYARWSARTGFQSAVVARIFLAYAVGLGLVITSTFYPLVAVAVPIYALYYCWHAAWRNLATIARATKQPYTFKEHWLALYIRLLYDWGTMRGYSSGLISRWFGGWAKRTQAYIQDGRQQVKAPAH